MDLTAASDLSSPTLSLGQNTPTNKDTLSKKRKRVEHFDELVSALDREPDDFKAAWYGSLAILDDNPIPARSEITVGICIERPLYAIGLHL
jgi:hypothetical protein